LGGGWSDHPADIWDNLILKGTPAEAAADAPLFSVMTFHDPRFTQPLLVVTNLSLAACHVLALYRDRWPVEQLPLAAKQMIGAHRAFVFAPEMCHRLPELALLAGAILWVRPFPLASGIARPSPRPVGCAASWPARDFRQISRCRGIRQKASVTDHLPKGSSLFRRQKRLVAVT
jgi:hypothetical protein